MKFKFALIFLIMYSWHFKSQAIEKKITLMIYVDQSSSMDTHTKKLAELVPYITDKMEKACSNYKIGVSNIAYNDVSFPYVRKNYLTPFGEPAFITKSTPDGIEELKKRILDPLSVISKIHAVATHDNEPSLSAREEITFSTLAESLPLISLELKDQDVFGALIFSDAKPVYETSSPENEIKKIKNLLGDTLFIAGAIAGKFDYSPTELVSSCNLDENSLGTSAKFYSQPNGLDEFSTKSGGWFWNICDDSYENSIKDFLQTVINTAGCQLMM
jgi:hypothetical protein